MTLVNAETGEIIADISADEAREITDRIKVAVEGAWLLIKQAYETRCWAALGYQSWDDYCTREFGTSRLKLPREERQEVVASLRDAGLSTRAIAAATGLSKSTIADGLSGVQNRTPAVDESYDRMREAMVETTRPKITGTDGKQYQPTTSERIKDAAKRNPPSDTVDRIAKAREMASQGYTSRQIADAIGITNISKFKATHGIEVPADAVVGKPKNTDSTRVMDQLALDARNVGAGSELIDFDSLDPARIPDWIESISAGITALTSVRRGLRTRHTEEPTDG